LKTRAAGSTKVVYHQLLGTQAQRTQRVQRIAAAIAKELLALGKLGAQEASWIEEAAQIAKVDCLIHMWLVPSTPGIMGQITRAMMVMRWKWLMP
jgi:glycyl-tRNA synthetase beta chain